MLKLAFTVFLFFSLRTLATDGGVTVGNGGDLIRCSSETSYWSLDYVLGRDHFGTKVKIVSRHHDLDDLMNRIEKLLLQKVPSLAASFSEFHSQLLNRDPSLRYLWVPKNFIDEIDDEDAKYIPFPCRNSTSPISGRQAVVRRMQPSGQVIFYYDRDAFYLIKDSSLHRSFVFVHEWLWNHTRRASHNRLVNYFLHSTLMDQLPAEEVQRRLRGYGLVIP